jgi:hypothetical protein
MLGWTQQYISHLKRGGSLQSAAQADPQGFTRKLPPIRIEDCARPGVLGQLVSTDRFGYCTGRETDARLPDGQQQHRQGGQITTEPARLRV